MARPSRRIRIDLAALQEIIESAGAIPAVSVSLDQQRVPAVLVGAAVIFGQEIDEELAGLAARGPPGDSAAA
jgi:hypothetical protein